MAELLKVDHEGWLKEVADIRENHYPKFGDKLPQELMHMLDVMEEKLNSAK
jgi:phosphoenolpyruvate carboxykinase (GTP)